MVKIDKIEYTLEPTGINKVTISFVGTSNKIIMKKITGGVINIIERKTENGINIDKTHTAPARFMHYGIIYDLLDYSSDLIVYTKDSLCDEIQSKGDFYQFTTVIKGKDFTLDIRNSCDLIYFKYAGRLEIHESANKALVETYNIVDKGILVRSYNTITGKVEKVNWITFDGFSYNAQYIGMIPGATSSYPSISMYERSIHYLNKQFIEGSPAYDYNNSDDMYPVFIDQINPDNSFSNTYYFITEEEDSDQNMVVKTIEFVYND